MNQPVAGFLLLEYARFPSRPSPHAGDNSNTQLAVLAPWAAQAIGHYFKWRTPRAFEWWYQNRSKSCPDTTGPS